MSTKPAMTDDELMRINAELCDRLGNPMEKPVEIADFATRALARVLSEAFRLKRENARLHRVYKTQAFAQG